MTQSSRNAEIEPTERENLIISELRLRAEQNDIEAIVEYIKYRGDRFCNLFAQNEAKFGLEKLKQLAKSGNNRALYELGYINLFWNPFGRIETKGIQQIYIAHENGLSEAIFDVALWYLMGSFGMKKDVKKAYEMFQRLENMGIEDATEQCNYIRQKYPDLIK